MSTILVFPQANISLPDLCNQLEVEVDTIKKITKLLSREEFTPTGSRYFNNAGDFSDWDFFISRQDAFYHPGGVGKDDNILQEMVNLGFVRIETSSFYSIRDNKIEDPSILSIWRYKNLFDVQIIKDEYIRAKRITQRMIEIFNANDFYKLSKRQRAEYWQAAMKLHMRY